MSTQSGLLASWNDTATRQAIVEFVSAVTYEASADFVAPDEQIAVFDNDGTLWPEKPIPIELDFTIRRFGQLEVEDPSLQDQQPYKAAYTHDFGWLNQAMVKHSHGDDADLDLLMQALPGRNDVFQVSRRHWSH